MLSALEVPAGAAQELLALARRAHVQHISWRAVAETGIDPRRIRAWPNSMEIAELFRGTRVAAAEAVDRWAPGLEVDALRAFLEDRDRGLDELWPLWDAVRAALGLGATAAA